MRPSSYKLYTNNPYTSKSRKFLKKKSNSQKKYFPIPDIITQIKPYLNNLNNLNSLIKPPNQHQVALTPNSHSRILAEELLLPKQSPEFLKDTHVPVAKRRPLFIASYSPLSFSLIHFDKFFSYFLMISRVPSVLPPSTITYSMLG